MLDSILGGIGYLGDVLDKPGRAVRGLLAGKLNEGLAALPFSDTIGLTDPANRTSGRELLGADDDTLGQLAGFGAELATDPLTLAGGAAGRLLGRSASRAASAMGPGYGTTADDLLRMSKDAPGFATPLMEGVAKPTVRGLAADTEYAGKHVRDLLNSPVAERVMSEIPPGSEMLGSGAHAFAVKTPQGDVIRVGMGEGGQPGRLVHDGILGTTRSVDVFAPGGQSARVERSPLATGVGSGGLERRNPATGMTPMEELQKGLNASGLNFFDSHVGNAGFHGGRPVVIDPGAVEPLAGGRGVYQFMNGRLTKTPAEQLGPIIPEADLAREAVVGAAEPGLLMRALLGVVDGRAATRRAVEAGRSGPNFQSPFAALGAGAGGVAGAFGRAYGDGLN